MARLQAVDYAMAQLFGCTMSSTDDGNSYTVLLHGYEVRNMQLLLTSTWSVSMKYRQKQPSMQRHSLLPRKSFDL